MKSVSTSNGQFIFILQWLVVLIFSYFLEKIIVEGIEPAKLFPFLALGVFLVSFIFWKKAVIFTMYWILLVGAVRKWLIPEVSDYIFFTPHLILSGVYLRFLGDRILRNYPLIKIKKYPVNILLGFLILWGILSVFNPRLPSFKVGILGIIVHFYYIPLLFIVHHLFPTKERLLSFLKKYALFSLPILILGIVQFFSPVNSPINRYVVETMDIAMTGIYPRVTSTFSYISGYTSYLNLLVLILIYLISLRKLSKILNIILYVLIALSIVNLFMTGSRGPVGISIISIALYFIIALKLGFTFIKKFLWRIIFIVSTVVLLITSTYLAKEAYEGFMERGRSTEDVLPRIVDTFTPFKFLKEAGLIGYGIGSTYQGAERLGLNWGDMPRDFEEEPERIVLELGLIGYLLVYGLRLLFLIYFWKLFKKLKDIDLKLLALCSLLFQLQFFHFNNLVFNLTSGFFYWFLVGFLFLLPKLDQKDISYAKN